MKKRYLGIIVIMLISLFSFVGCGNEDSSDNEDNEKPVVTEQANTETKEPTDGEIKEPSGEETQEPEETKEPADAETQEPEETQKPADVETQEPEETQKPADVETQEPEETQKPADVETQEPEETQKPSDEPTKEPETGKVEKLKKEGVYTLYNEATKTYLSFEDRTLVLSKTPANWRFVVELNDVFRIFAGDSDLMLDIDNAIVKEGTTVKIWTRTQYDVQLWNAIKNKNGTYSIVYSIDNTFCLGFNNGKAELQHRNETNSMQEWKLVEVDTKTEEPNVEDPSDVGEVKTGIYTLYNEATSSYLSFNDKTLVLSKNPSNWRVNEVHNDVFHIYAEDTETLLDIDNARVKEGTTIKLWTLTGYDVQLWNLNKNDNGTYTIAYSGDNKYCLGISGGDAKLQIRDTYNSAQEWKLVDVTASNKSKYRTYISENGVIELQLPVNITDVISETRLQQWANDLETAYYTFKELTNYTPYEHIIVQAYKEEKHIGWVINNSNIIHIDKDFISEDLTKMAQRDSDWNFCALHEMGHMFDMGQAWNFEAEVLTDIKVAYVLEKNGVAAAPSEFPASEYFYGADIIKAYDRLGGDFSKSYNIYGIAKRFLEIKEDTGWEAFIKTFYDLREKESSYTKCSNKEKFKAFVDRLAFYGNKDVKGCFSNDEWDVIINEIDS